MTPKRDADERWWRVGEVAKMTGLTVRTLHHYDERGLVVPSGRSHADYRLYDATDLRRLLAVTHLKSLGLSLDGIAAALDDPDFSLDATLAAQIDELRAEIATQQRLLTRLEALAMSPARGWEDVVDAIALTERLHAADPAIRLRAALDAPGRTPLPELVERVRREPVDGVRETLTWAIAQHGTAATPLILEHLADPDPAVRRQMAHVLSKLKDPSATDALAALIEDPDEAVAAKAAFALGRIAGERATGARAKDALRASTDERPLVRQEIDDALGIAR